MRVGVNDRIEFKAEIGEKRQVSINFLPNRIDQKRHMILFAPDEIRFALRPVQLTKNHLSLPQLFI